MCQLKKKKVHQKVWFQKVWFGAAVKFDGKSANYLEISIHFFRVVVVSYIMMNEQQLGIQYCNQLVIVGHQHQQHAGQKNNNDAALQYTCLEVQGVLSEIEEILLAHAWRRWEEYSSYSDDEPHPAVDGE
jgi:hypothetical protein